ncbi:MAG: YdcF family protein [Rhodobacteraceae bacterium]|nr:YdcF family protein [Paracoccaceae bacterium]
MIWRLLLLGLAGFGVSLALVCITALWHVRGRLPDNADVIMVLGAATEVDGTLGKPALARVQTGVELWRRGLAPEILFTGGPALPSFRAHGALMADAARALGVPEEAIIIEAGAHSTLQNALLSQPLIPDRRVILVTHGYHMTRSRLSLAWAGIPVAGYATPGAFTGARDALREALATPFNAGRVALWHVLGWTGMDPGRRLRMLAQAPGKRHHKG